MVVHHTLMQFTFRRDEEGCERIYVGDVCVARMIGTNRNWLWTTVPVDADVDDADINDAIECADEAGFWEMEPIIGATGAGCRFEVNDVTVDVSVPAHTGEIPSVGGVP